MCLSHAFDNIMALRVCFSRVLLLCFIVSYLNNGSKSEKMQPIITSISLVNVTFMTNTNNEDFSRMLVQMLGSDLDSWTRVRPTLRSSVRNSECVNEIDSDLWSYTFNEVWSNSTFAYMTLTIPSDLAFSGTFFLCVENRIVEKDGALNTLGSSFSGDVVKWIHQGDDVVLQSHSVYSEEEEETARAAGVHENSRSSLRGRRLRRDAAAATPPTPPPTTPTPSTPSEEEAWGPVVTGLRVERSAREPVRGDDGVVALLAGSTATLRLFGARLSNDTLFTFTKRAQPRGPCHFPEPDFVPVVADARGDSALVRVLVPAGESRVFYACVKASEGEAGAPADWRHQGAARWTALRSYHKLLPLWVAVVVIVVCLTFSALFSGLNLGLMSMDQTDLKIVANTGSAQERRYAEAIMPVRKMGNYLLCSILLGNVLVNSTFTILLDDLTSGIVAIVVSTLAIVVFGEISPQAVCSRHGLAVGAKTILITKMVMIITFPLSYPISKLLDRLLGVELGNVYNRERLKELVKVTNEYNDLEKDEVNIIAGALEFRKKVVCDVMTKLEDVFMLSHDAILDFETVSEIMKQGYSRIPVYDGVRSNIVTVLYIKDLAFVDPDDNTPLQTLCNFYQNPCNFVFEDTTLDIMFKQFKEGIKGHMAIVQRVNNEGDGDPFYETIGIVTLEDVIEELIQSEIVDETDVWTDNRSKRRRNEKTNRQDFTVFAERRENQRIHISPQLTLATFQYLSTAVDAFKPDIISETILRRLLKQDIIYHIKVKSKEKARHDPACVIYSQGKAVDYFVLILEGRVEVTVGRESMMFESGPFVYFGCQALTQNVGVADSPTSPAPQNLGSLQSVNLDAMLRYTFVPDYTVRAVTEVFYIKIKRSLYLAAKRATLMELAKKDTQTDEHFDDEVEKLLHSLDDDDRSQGGMDSPPSRSHLIQMDRELLQQQQQLAAAERPGVGAGPAVSPALNGNAARAAPPPSLHVSPAHGAPPKGAPPKGPPPKGPPPTLEGEERVTLLPKC